eukprot:1798707-Pleurochrysis_carterae.AAC.1
MAVQQAKQSLKLNRGGGIRLCRGSAESSSSGSGQTGLEHEQGEKREQIEDESACTARGRRAHTAAEAAAARPR